MTLEYELLGSKVLHKGIVETTGFWVTFKENGEWFNDNFHVDGYLISNNGSFAFYHTDKGVAKDVYQMLLSAFRGSDTEDTEIGYIREVY